MKQGIKDQPFEVQEWLSEDANSGDFFDNSNQSEKENLGIKIKKPLHSACLNKLIHHINFLDNQVHVGLSNYKI